MPSRPIPQPNTSTAPFGMATQEVDTSSGSATRHGCQPPSTSAADPAGNWTRNTVSTSGIGAVANSNEVTTPKLPPPPPRNAQNSSDSQSSDAVTTRLSTVTILAARNLSHTRPYVRCVQPRPPPRVNPAM